LAPFNHPLTPSLSRRGIKASQISSLAPRDRLAWTFRPPRARSARKLNLLGYQTEMGQWVKLERL